jgi:Glycosyl hydrolase family 26
MSKRLFYGLLAFSLFLRAHGDSAPVLQENGKPLCSVYVGNDIDHTAVPKFEAWLGRPTDALLAYTGAANWQDYDGSVGWLIDLCAKSNRRVLWSIPLIPKGATLTEAASGAYNEHWRKIAVQMAQWHPAEPVLYIRTAWEFNGDWFPWSSHKDPQAFIGAWRQFVTVFRAVSDRFRFDWCPNGSTDFAEEAYPGDAYVDIIGLDVYDEAKWCKIKDPAERWNKFTLNGGHMLLWHQAFAQAHHKPMSYPEWGVGGNDSGDNPYFIEHMHQWFLDNHVIYASYWDSNADYPGKLSDGQYPQAGAKYRELFGVVPKASP